MFCIMGLQRSTVILAWVLGRKLVDNTLLLRLRIAVIVQVTAVTVSTIMRSRPGTPHRTT